MFCGTFSLSRCVYLFKSLVLELTRRKNCKNEKTAAGARSGRVGDLGLASIKLAADGVFFLFFFLL